MTGLTRLWTPVEWRKTGPLMLSELDQMRQDSKSPTLLPASPPLSLVSKRCSAPPSTCSACSNWASADNSLSARGAQIFETGSRSRVPFLQTETWEKEKNFPRGFFHKCFAARAKKKADEARANTWFCCFDMRHRVKICAWSYTFLGIFKIHYKILAVEFRKLGQTRWYGDRAFWNIITQEDVNCGLEGEPLPAGFAYMKLLRTMTERNKLCVQSLAIQEFFSPSKYTKNRYNGIWFFKTFLGEHSPRPTSSAQDLPKLFAFRTQVDWRLETDPRGLLVILTR